MTYGALLDQARGHLRDAIVDAASGDVATLAAIPANRWYLYRQLRRHLDLLTAGSLVRNSASTLRFGEALNAAAGSGDGLVSQARGRTALGAAADRLAVAADLLATHTAAGHAHTPAGAAIIAGGGVPAALADLGQLALDAVALDLAVSERLNRGPHVVFESLHAAAVASARPAVKGPLAQLAQDLVAAGAGRPPLLRQLNVATPITAVPDAPVRTAAEAASQLGVALTWLWQNPRDLRADHLRLATRLGLGIAMLQQHPAAVRAWKTAATSARRISGSPPLHEGWRVGETMRAIARWVTSIIDSRGRPDVAALADQLPKLAETLLGALPSAIYGGDILTGRPELRRRPGSLIIRAVDVWHRASMSDDEITDIRDALDHAIRVGLPGHGTGEASPARRAFQTPPRPGTAAPAKSHLPSTTVTPRRRQRRS